MSLKRRAPNDVLISHSPPSVVKRPLFPTSPTLSFSFTKISHRFTHTRAVLDTAKVTLSTHGNGNDPLSLSLCVCVCMFVCGTLTPNDGATFLFLSVCKSNRVCLLGFASCMVKCEANIRRTTWSYLQKKQAASSSSQPITNCSRTCAAYLSSITLALTQRLHNFATAARSL